MMEERDSLKTLAQKSRAPLGTCWRVGIRAWTIEDRAGRGCMGREGTGREAGGTVEGGIREQLSFGCNNGRSAPCDEPCGPRLRQRPHLLGRQLEQDLPVLTQTHLLQIPDLLQRQQALLIDSKVGGGGGEVVWGTNNCYLSSFPSSCIVYT